MTDLMHIVIAGVSLFLIGANCAFLLHLGSRLVPWFTTKIVAVTLLLAYVGASAVWGNPQAYRLALGGVAVILDFVALYRMWLGITNLRSRGVVGLVPLLRSDDGDRVD